MIKILINGLFKMIWLTYVCGYVLPSAVQLNSISKEILKVEPLNASVAMIRERLHLRELRVP